MEYAEFLKSKEHIGKDVGFDDIYIPKFLFDFQKELLICALKKGRSAIFADCGLGKTPIQLVWAENVVRKTNKPALIITPLAVSHQTEEEGHKFNIECSISRDGKPKKNITITNYEKLHLFDSNDYSGVVCDESSSIKNFDGMRKKIVTEFMRKKQYRLLCTATAAPNDFIELGTSSEALGELGRMDMLSRFFVNDENSNHPVWWGARWRFKKHGEMPFWKWVASWARAIKQPSDMGFDDGDFKLPELFNYESIVKNNKPLIIDGQVNMFPIEAKTLSEQRAERRDTLKSRCETVLSKVDKFDHSVIWCHLNDEGKLLKEIIPESVEVCGSDTDEKKEEMFKLFHHGHIKRLITKPKIGGFGLNWQHCNHMTFFPSHSYEQYYQGVRRCYRYGQKRDVHVDIITSEGERGVFKNLKRKSDQAEIMFSKLIKYMNEGMAIKEKENLTKMEVPSWM
jgi:hypothetical protein|tara:strand:- start:1324 stop:2685 length:1362 start_codon:yes stop_codon:yes gene_type:complete